MMDSPALFLAGPTAVGKTAIALKLAQKLNGEIISVDSMNVYRGLDIGTAKPSKAEREQIPHHLIDVVDIQENFDAARFCTLAHQAEMEIRARNKRPIFCGGTGLYFKAYIEGLDPLPTRDSERRSELQKLSMAELQATLFHLDPLAKEVIDMQNPRRVIRAIEIVTGTGKPLKQNRQLWQPKPMGALQTLLVLSRPREELVQRINQRVDRMFADGLVEETRSLMHSGLVENVTARQAIGYRQVIEHLQGERGLKETVELVKIRTRQFAKRQMTWFRGHPSAKWQELSKDEDPELEELI